MDNLSLMQMLYSIN